MAAVLAGILALSLAAPANGAESRAAAAAAAPLSNQNAVVQETPPPASTDDPAEGTTTQPVDGSTDQGTSDTSIGEDLRDPGFANAAHESPAAKAAEAKQDCVPDRPPISKMLAAGGIVAGDEGSSWNGLVIVIAVVALLVWITAFLIRRHRSPSGTPSPRGALEIISTVIAILGGVVGLAVQFVPGIGVKEKPAPEATMTVRDVQARIKKSEYASKTGADRRLLDKFERRQVGNVVWLEIALQGYSGKHAVLQYASYDPRAGGALLPGTEKKVPLRIEDKDSQKSFVPIWVGYPKSEKFSAQFRLLAGNPAQVRQIADTGTMRGSKFRYSC